MAKILVLHIRPDGYLAFGYDDIVNLISDPMYIANDDGLEQEYFLRNYGRSFVHTFVSRLQKAIDIMEKAGTVEHVDLDIYIPGEEWIAFRSDYDNSAHSLDTKRLRELLAKPVTHGEKEKSEEYQRLADVASRILTENGIDDKQPVARATILRLAKIMRERTSANIVTCKRHIWRAIYRARWIKSKPKLPMYQMWSEGGYEDLDAQTEEEALAEMDERWPGWRKSATMGLYYDPNVYDPNSKIMTYDPDSKEWVPL
jgi:hypothetical protein